MGEEGEARCKVVKTNSGEGSVDMCDRKRCFQGAGAVERWWAIDDISRRKGISRTRDESGAILVTRQKRILRDELEGTAAVKEENCSENEIEYRNAVQEDIHNGTAGNSGK